VFRNNTGGTFNVTGLTLMIQFVTGGTYTDGTATFRNNTGGTFNVIGFSALTEVAAITVENISNLFSTALNAGTNLTNVNYSIFFRVDTGYSATSANNSNFIGNRW
jgi:hypothetical protein